MSEYAVNGRKVADSTKINFKANPKRAGFNAYKRYEIYQYATTVAELKEMNPVYFKADFKYDEMKGFIEFIEE